MVAVSLFGDFEDAFRRDSDAGQNSDACGEPGQGFHGIEFFFGRDVQDFIITWDSNFGTQVGDSGQRQADDFVMQTVNSKELIVLFQGSKGGRGTFDVMKNFEMHHVGTRVFGAEEDPTIRFLGVVVSFSQHGVPPNGFRLSHEGILGVGEHGLVVHHLKPNGVIGSGRRGGETKTHGAVGCECKETIKIN